MPVTFLESSWVSPSREMFRRMSVLYSCHRSVRVEGASTGVSGEEV